VVFYGKNIREGGGLMKTKRVIGTFWSLWKSKRGKAVRIDHERNKSHPGETTRGGKNNGPRVKEERLIRVFHAERIRLWDTGGSEGRASDLQGGLQKTQVNHERGIRSCEEIIFADRKRPAGGVRGRAKHEELISGATGLGEKERKKVKRKRITNKDRKKRKTKHIEP